MAKLSNDLKANATLDSGVIILNQDSVNYKNNSSVDKVHDSVCDSALNTCVAIRSNTSASCYDYGTSSGSNDSHSKSLLDNVNFSHDKSNINVMYNYSTNGNDSLFSIFHDFGNSYEDVTGNSNDSLMNGTLSNGSTNSLNSNNVSVFYFNARSIKNKISDFHARVEVEKPHIIAITESWLDDSFNDAEVFPSDYCVFRNDRNSHGGGVALGILSCFNPILKNDFLSDHIEIVWVEFDSIDGKNLFGVYYRPPSQNKSGLSVLDDNLSKINGCRKLYNFCALVGDFNIHTDWINDHTITGSLPNCLLDTMQSSGFTQILKEPTYRTRNGIDHFLDLVFVSDPSYVVSCSSTCNLHGCDHSAAEIILKMSPLKARSAIKKSVYCLNKADFNQLKFNLFNCQWYSCIDQTDVDVMWNRFESSLKTCIDNSVPKKVVKKNKNLPWMTKEIRKLCTKKKMLYKRSKCSKSVAAQQQFKDCSNKLKSLIRKSHSMYTYDISNDYGNNPKRFWSYVASKKKCPDISCFSIDGDAVNDTETIASAFNKYFSSKFDGMYDPIDLTSIDDSPPIHGTSPISFNPFTVNEVLEVLQNLNTSKSPDPDEILPVFLKVCCVDLAPVLCTLFNAFISKGEVPTAWKDANVVPIYKGSGKPKDDVASYRPVSLTSVLG